MIGHSWRNYDPSRGSPSRSLEGVELRAKKMTERYWGDRGTGEHLMQECGRWFEIEVLVHAAASKPRVVLST